MASWFQRVFAPKQDPVTATPTVRDTAFATGAANDRPSNRLSLMRRQQAAMAMTFQRGVESLVPQMPAGVGDNGGPTFALDEAYPDLTQAKMANAKGGWVPIPQLEFYASQGFIGWQMCAILSQNWLIDKVCGQPAADAVRNGYDVLFDDGEKLDPDVANAIRRADKRMGVKEHARIFMKKSRIFGIRHALFLVDGIDYAAPFNPDGIRPGSYKGIVQIDPYWIAPVLDQAAAANPASKEFYDPTWWQINGKLYHKSHFVITRCGDEVVDILKPSYYYGGIPLPQKLYNRVFAAERVADEAPMLAMAKRLMVLKTDLTKWYGPDAAAATVQQEFMEYQNNWSLRVIGTDDEASQLETSLQGLDETIMTQYQLVCAIGGVPSTKILGTSPKGFNATGEYDESSYHEELESMQETTATPLIERHHLCLWRSKIAPKFGLDTKRGMEINWRATDSMTAKEIAEVNKIKADTDASLVTAGTIDALDSRRRVINDPDSGYTGIEEVVPDGPGDREAEQEMKQALLDAPKDAAQDSAPAAGIAYFADGKVLLVKNRDEADYAGWWGFPAGKVEAGESVLEAACREFAEETGKKLYRGSFAWGDEAFALFAAYGEEFTPMLSDEHSAYMWADVDALPEPLHPRCRMQLEAITGCTLVGVPSVS